MSFTQNEEIDLYWSRERLALFAQPFCCLSGLCQEPDTHTDWKVNSSIERVMANSHQSHSLPDFTAKKKVAEATASGYFHSYANNVRNLSYFYMNLMCQYWCITNREALSIYRRASKHHVFISLSSFPLFCSLSSLFPSCLHTLLWHPYSCS